MIQTNVHIAMCNQNVSRNIEGMREIDLLVLKHEEYLKERTTDEMMTNGKRHMFARLDRERMRQREQERKNDRERALPSNIMVAGGGSMREKERGGTSEGSV